MTESVSRGGVSKGVQIAVGATLVAALLGWYGWTSLGEASYRYYSTLEELRAADPGDVPVRVHGYVAPGSIERDVAARQVHFAVQSDPPHAAPAAEAAGRVDRLPVVYSSLETPDLFQDAAEVVVEGRLAPGRGGSVLLADNVLAKCPSKFQAEVADAPEGGAPASL